MEKIQENLKVISNNFLEASQTLKTEDEAAKWFEKQLIEASALIMPRKRVVFSKVI